MTNIMSANTAWRDRPRDEKFWDIASLKAKAIAKKKQSIEKVAKMDGIRLVPVAGDGMMVESKASEGKPARRARLSNLAFSQAAAIAGMPSTALARLSNRLAAECVNELLDKRAAEKAEGDPDIEAEIQLLLDSGTDGITVRSINSDSYARVHDADIMHLPETLSGLGWKVPPARPSNEDDETRLATEADVLAFGTGGVQLRVGDAISPAGLYMGDRDLFILMVDDKHQIDDGGGYPLMRIMIIRNSEVGLGSFSITTALAQGVCGNLIIWQAQDILQIRYRHVGEVAKRVSDALKMAVLNPGAPKLDHELRVFDWMRRTRIGESRQEVIDAIYKTRIQALTKKLLAQAIDNAEQHRGVDGDPYSWWGLANALTRVSQTAKHMSTRYGIDTAAGQVFALAAGESGLTAPAPVAKQPA